MKKIQRQLKRITCMILVLCMLIGSFSGCSFGEKVVNEDVQDTATENMQDVTTEIDEIVLSSKNQNAILLLAGEKPKLQFDTTAGIIEAIMVTPKDEILELYRYYTVTVTIAAKENEIFAKSLSAILDGVQLKIKEWSEDKLIIEYTALALPEIVITEAMSEISSYKNAKNEKIIGTAKVQAMLDYELNIFSVDGESSYVIDKWFIPLFMTPAFVANGPLEQIKDGTTVQIISEHGENDFEGTQGQWYKIAADGKVGYVPVSFVKDVEIAEKDTTTQQTKQPGIVQTKPAMKPTIVQPDEIIDEDNSDNNGNADNGGDNGSDNENDSNSDSDNGIQKVTYYQVSFVLGGGISGEDAFLPKAIMVRENSALSLNQLATPSVPGYLFEGWFYDSALTRQVQNGDIINSNITLYAKLREITEEEVTIGEENYISSVEVNASDFKVAILKPAVMRSTEAVKDIVRLRDVANPESFLEVQISAAEQITLENISYEKYLITSKELEAGATYQMELLSDKYVFYYEEQLQDAAVRLYNFTTKMEEVENLSLNNNLIYLKKEEIRYTEGSDDVSGLFSATVEDDITQLNTIEGNGSFIYTGNQSIGAGSTVVIYDGTEAPKLGEGGLDSAEQYNGKAAYLTISKVEGDTFYYGVAEAEDVLFTPDVLPVNMADDEDENNNTITIDTEKLRFSGDDYEEMGLDEETTVDVGDYLAFYSGSLETATELTYGKIIAISVSGEDTILTYEVVEENEVLESMTVYSKGEVDFDLDEDTAAAIEREMEQDAIDSGFAMEAANYLAELALVTEEMQTLKEEMGIKSLTYSLENSEGATVSKREVDLRAGNNVKVEGLKVKANVSRKLENLGDKSSKYDNGVRAQLEVSFNITVGSGENKLVLKVSAIFEQEVLLDLNIKGKTIWGKKWIFPYIKDYRVTTNLDVGTYTGIAITATVMTDNKPEYDWSTVDKSLSEQIRELMNQQDKFFNQDINSIGGGLAGKYADMMKNNSEWVELVEVKIFSAEAKILAGIIVVGVQADFIVSAKVNIMLGMSFEYGVAKRYTFTLNVFAKTSSSDSVDLEKSHYSFDMYVMGTLGVRAGVRLTVYAGLFSKKVAAIGVTAEAGAYLQLWGYFFYSNHWEQGSGKSSSVSGAMLMEIGAYLEIRFLATAFGGVFEYNPILYDKYWPLWNIGSVENVYDFNYKTTVGVTDDKDIHMGAALSVALPADRMNMNYMNLRDGKINNKTYTYRDFTITTTGNFTYENGVIKVNPKEGSAEEKGTIKLTWNGAELSFTSQPLSCEIDLVWSDPSRVHSVSYELHGGKAMENGNVLTEGIPNTEVATGGKFTAPAVELVKEYYTFGGWYKDTNYTEAWDFDVDKVSGNLVLHAKWIPVAYDIMYELNGGSNHSSNPATYTIETAVTLEEPVRAGYAFAGWNTAADGTGSNVTEIPVGSYGAKTFYAQWSALEQTYEIHHMLQGVDGTTYELKETVTATAKTGETITVGAEQSKAYTGFTYDMNFATEGTGIIPEEGTLVLKLYYSRNIYDVTFVSVEGAEPVVVPTVYQGKLTEPEKPLKEGYDFTGWYVITDESRLWDFENDLVTEAIELRAGWTAKEYNVVFDLKNGIGGDSNVKVYYDSVLTNIAVPARKGYQFLGYFDADGKQYYNSDGSGTQVWDKAELSDGMEYFTLYAKWQANNYEIVFDANGGTGIIDNQTFVYGEEKALAANSFVRTGYAFAGWAMVANAEEAVFADEEVVKNLSAVDETITLYAVWTPVTYAIIFDGNNATDGSMEQQAMRYDIETSLQANTFTKTGYHFMGWATVANAEVVYADKASVKNLSEKAESTVTLYAVWEPNTYSIAFYANGGEGTMESQSFTYDETAKALSLNAYSRTGYHFVGWATDSTATSAEYADGQTVQNLISEHQKTLALYAVWQANSYIINFDGNDATSGSMEAESFTYGEEKALTSNRFTRTGYTFMGWATESETISPKYIDGQVVENLTSEDQKILTLYAVWQANHYTIHFESNKGIGSSEPTIADDIKVIYNSTYGNLPEVSREGYTFNGWYTAVSGGTQIQAADKVLLTEDQTLYAQWSQNSYKVTFNAGEGHFANATNEEIIQTYDSKYELPQTNPTREGYTFLGWFTDDGTEVTNDTNMVKAQEHTLDAQWQVNQYTVYFESNKGTGSSTPTTASDMIVNYGSMYGSLPEVSREGYTFNGWYTAVSGGTQIQAADKVLLTEDQTLYAQWSQNSYKVTFNAGEGHFANAANEEIIQTYDSKYELPQTNPTREGYTFLGWFTDDGTEVTNDTNMVKAQEHTLYAQWQAITVNNISVKAGDVTLSYEGSPVYAKTDSDGNVTLGGSEADYNIKLENGVLTLNNAVITYAPISNYHNGALSATGNLTITLAEGTQNVITNTSANSGISAWNCGVYVDGNLTINGGGSLIAYGGKGQSSHGISVDSANGNLIIDGAVVKAYGGDAAGSSGIYTYVDLEIKNGATVDAVGGNVSSGKSLGFEVQGTITITNSCGSAEGKTQAMNKMPAISEAASQGIYTDQMMTWTK